MDAIYKVYDLPQATHLTLQAGADVAMPLGSLELQQQCFQTLLDWADTLDLDGPTARILDFKAKFCSPQPVAPFSAVQDVAVIREVARRSITLLETDAQAVPLPLPAAEPQPLVIDFELASATPVEEGRRPGPFLKALLTAYWPHLTYLTLPAEATDPAQALELAQIASLVIILARNALYQPTQARLIRDLIVRQPHAVLVAARDPYDLALVGPSVCRLATYGDPPLSLTALVEVLTGQKKPVGQLPVELPPVPISL